MSLSASFLKSKGLWGLVILLLGFFGAYYILSSAPKPSRVKPQPQARLVDAITLPAETSRPYWNTGSSVTAVDAVSLVFQVSGRVDWVNPDAAPGALLTQGTVLARLEQTDFSLQTQQAQASLVQAQADLSIEKGQGALAREEYALAASDLSQEEQDLVMRKPQLLAAQAAVSLAQAELLQAKLNQTRSEIRMPFDGQISSRAISVGSYATSGTVVFDVVGTSRLWIEVKVPRSFLNWLDTDAMAELSLPSWNGKRRQASILSTMPDVDDMDRQARIILLLEQSLENGQPVVLVNDYLNVRLPGRSITGSVIESRLLNDDDSLWVINNEKLYRRQPEIIFRGREKIWLGQGLERGDQLLLNRIDSATSGMAVRVRNIEVDSKAGTDSNTAADSTGNSSAGGRL